MITIRACDGFEELEACVQLQIETWGYDESDVVPRKAFLVAQKIGGQVIGAFDTEIAGGGPESGAESLVGFAFSLPGVKSGRGEPQAYLHSHMLAVKEGYRNRGLGAQLKLEQRREALSRGIRLMEWTLIHWKSKTLISISTGWERWFASTEPISMVYPHLDCRVGCRRIVYWRSGGWIRRGLRAILRGPSGSRARHRGTYTGSSFDLRMEGQRSRAGTSPRRSDGEPPEVSTGIFSRVGRSWLRPGCGRKWNLRVGSPYSIDDGVNSKGT